MFSEVENTIFFVYLLWAAILAQQLPPPPIPLGATYFTDFNTLQGGTEGQKLQFQQGTTIPGWWSNGDQYLVSYGSLNEGGLYSYGAEDSNADRSFGAQNSLTHKTVFLGLSGNSSTPVTGFAATFTAKQFRWGNSTVPSTVTFEYSIQSPQQYFNGGWGGNPNVNPVGWITVPSLSFSSLCNCSPSDPVGPLSPPPSQIFSANITVAFPIGYIVQFRWTARNVKDGLAIDDVQISFLSEPPTPSPPTPTPTPTSAPVSPVDESKWKKIAFSGWGVAGLLLVLASAVALGAFVY